LVGPTNNETSKKILLCHIEDVKQQQQQQQRVATQLASFPRTALPKLFKIGNN
jgi:hypothetical protein